MRENLMCAKTIIIIEQIELTGILFTVANTLEIFRKYTI